MGVPEEQVIPTATVPGHIPDQGSRHHNNVDSASASSESIKKTDEALDEKDGKLTGDVSKKERGQDEETQPGHEPEDHSKYPHGFKLVTLIIALCLAVFLVALDQTIIATAIPK